MGQAKQRGSFEDRKSKAINNYSIKGDNIMKKKNKPIIKYPSSITKWFHTAKELENPSEVLNDDPIYNHVQGMLGIIKKSGLGDKVRYSLSDEGDNVEVQILIPDGRIFTGIAIMKEGDINNPAKALCIAIGRAIAVWRASTTKPQQIYGVEVRHNFDRRCRWANHSCPIPRDIPRFAPSDCDTCVYKLNRQPFNIKDILCPVKTHGFTVKCLDKQITLICKSCMYKEARELFKPKGIIQNNDK